jgi:HlyD family secretion protein
MRNSVLVVSLSLILSVAASALTAWLVVNSRWRSPTTDAGETPKNNTPVERSRVKALGRIEPAQGVIQLGAPPGDRVLEIKVEEGDTVEAGAVVAVLESYALRQAEVNVAAASLDAARRQEPAVKAQGAAQLAEAERLEQAAKLGSIDLEAQTLRLEQLRLASQQANDDAQRVADVANNVLAPQSRERLKLAASQASSQLKVAEQELGKATQAYQQNIAAAQAKKEAVALDQQRLLAALQIDVLEKQLDLSKARAEAAVVRAPMAGTILQRIAHVGEPTGANAILWMAQLTGMVVVAEVYETDVALVRAGQEVSITADAWATLDGQRPKELKGTVRHVGTVVTRNNERSLDPAARNDVRVVPVRIEIGDPANPHDSDRAEAARWIHLQVNVEIKLGSAAAGAVPPAPGE